MTDKRLQMKINIDFNTKWIKRDPEWLATFLQGYLSSLRGYTVTNVEIVDDKGTKVENISVSCEDCGELFTHEPHKCIHVGG
tara:strand:+ start:7410 stop:7655 length:246 start_codon:yes stop_codon:yes gene_type:complete